MMQINKKLYSKNYIVTYICLFFVLIYPWVVCKIISVRDQYSKFYGNSLKVFKNKNNPIFTHSKGDEWDSHNHVAGNCFIKDKDGRLVLLYYAAGDNSSVTSIGLASSIDGENFTRLDTPVLSPGKQGEWDSGGVSVYPNCVLQLKDGSYMMYYSGFSEGTPDLYHSGAIGVATSNDLIQWKKYEKNPIIRPGERDSWESWGVFEPSVHYNGNPYGALGSYKMWYGGSDENLRFQIGYAESKDGYNWVKSEDNPVVSYTDNGIDFDSYSIEVHSVSMVNNKYVMFYEAIRESFPYPFSIGMAISDDGVRWVKSRNNPILEGGMIGEWDAMGTYHPSLVHVENKYLLYYVGLDYLYTHRIGVAELNPEILELIN